LGTVLILPVLHAAKTRSHKAMHFGVCYVGKVWKECAQKSFECNKHFIYSLLYNTVSITCVKCDDRWYVN